MRIGYGEDAHALAEGRPLVLGNVRVPSRRGAVAHSDGDVLLHALSDALLSALALGDIGLYFPPSDPRHEGVSSADILEHVRSLIGQQAGNTGMVIFNVAAVITLDEPKLSPYREAIGARVAALLELSPERVGIGFKTSEGLAKEHVQARVTVLLSTA
jgi:2-C-methyl-D-erythritol 2,4-cyclodiphosphate synthase